MKPGGGGEMKARANSHAAKGIGRKAEKKLPMAKQSPVTKTYHRRYNLRSKLQKP